MTPPLYTIHGSDRAGHTWAEYGVWERRHANATMAYLRSVNGKHGYKYRAVPVVTVEQAVNENKEQAVSDSMEQA